VMSTLPLLAVLLQSITMQQASSSTAASDASEHLASATAAENHHCRECSREVVKTVAFKNA